MAVACIACISTAALAATADPAGAWSLAANDVIGVGVPTAITTTASASVGVGGKVSDRATLSGGVDPTGSITFTLYGPGDTSCSTPVDTSTVTVDHGNGDYDSAAITAAHAGTYRWIAAYSGDTANAPSTGSCNDAGESVTVTQAQTSITTAASDPVAVGGTISDTATLAGGASPGGTVTFKLYGPSDAKCSGTPVSTSTATVSDNGNYSSAGVVATRAGTYRWVASYGGDSDNAATSGKCGDSGESVTVAQARPTVTADASSPVGVGGQISASATLTGAFAPSGEIEFRLYGPHDPSCSGAPLATSRRGVSHNGGYRSDGFVAHEAGTYRWVVSYGGDANNAAGASACGDPAAAVLVDGMHTTIDVGRSAQVLLAMTASAPDTSWSLPGRTSAVATITVDGRYSQDVVLFGGLFPFVYRVALGSLKAGHHEVRVRFNPAKSPAGARGVAVTRLDTSIATDAAASVARYAPILYGRDLPEIAGRFENNHTDTPLVLYHTVTDDGGGYTTIEYSVIWSNEDGGTPTDALMARWGHTTDIEWVYRVRLDPAGRRVAEAYQDYRHNTLPFRGLHEDGHPLLQTAAANNGVYAVEDRARASRYRFFLDPRSRLPLRHAREEEMDAHPWTYALTAFELEREHKVEHPASPATPAVSDSRNYLFVRLEKHSYPTKHARSKAYLGAAVGVRLKGAARWYWSDHGNMDWSVENDGPATTTVELPPGTRPQDVAEIKPAADPVGSVPRYWRISVQITSAFFLDRAYVPKPLANVGATRVTLKPRRS